MSRVYFISDLHLGHKNILNFAGEYRGGVDSETHDQWLVDQINSVVGRRDTLWILGDICFTDEASKYLKQINGFKVFILGNHDFNLKKNSMLMELPHVRGVYGLTTYKGFWISHCPIHPGEIRDRRGNIHGHVHQNVIKDWRYYPVCVEQCGGIPIPFDEIMALHETRKHFD